MIIVYTEQENPRLDFILTQLINRIAGSEFSTTTKREEYLKSSLPGICYCQEYAGRGLWVLPSGLLGEKTWRPLVPSQSALKNGTPILFPTGSFPGSFPWDLFSAAFYLLTRYEEYYSRDTDIHGRYLPTSSVLHQMGCLQIPIIEVWMQYFRERFLELYPDCCFPPRNHRIQLTHDIDHPFLYRNKGILLTTYGLVRDLLKGRFGAARTRLKVLLYLQEDPYFNLVYLKKIGQKNGFNPLFFIHAGPYGKYDRKNVYSSLRYEKTLKKLSQESNLGLHPSYGSHSKAEAIRRERERLERWIGKKVKISRQHYLRFTFPETPRALLDAGIHQDYSLGYSHECGFRAGTSVPFPFFDLESNQETDLMLHPLIAMDVTFKRDLGMSPSDTKKKILFLNEQCRTAGGDFTLLIHNSSLVHFDGWEGWKEMYETLLKELKYECPPHESH